MVKNLGKQKVSLLLGARRVGKTELLEKMAADLPDVLWLNGEDTDTADLLEKRTIANYRNILQNKKLLLIDEAQYIPEISLKAKLMIDNIKPLHIVLTGSSAFDLHQMSEPLVGRTITYNIYPLAQLEFKAQENALQTKQKLEERLIYGGYPELTEIKDFREKAAYLRELTNTYLLKDILAFEDIRQPQKLRNLLILLAYQVGSEVSVNELGTQLGISKNTVDKYLDLLTKVFVIYSRSGYSGNLRKEVVKSKRWYFIDNGIRNALINNFQPLALRQDVGALWEQYFLSERIKRNGYLGHTVNSWFWRTYDQQEIDLIEEKADSLAALECKWGKGKAKVPMAWAGAYPEATFTVANPENYLKLIT